MRMTRICWSLILTLPLLPATEVAASIITAGNSAPDGSRDFSFYYQQGFSASVSGDLGTGTVPATGNVYLESIFVDYNSAQTGTLYLFENWYMGTPGAMSGLSIGDSGLIAKSTGVSGNTWIFDSIGLDVNDTYFFAADFQAGALISVNVNTYGDEDDQYLSGANSGDFTSGFLTLGDDDIAFLATFNDSITSTPEPTSMALLGLASLGGIGLRLRRVRKSSDAKSAA